MACKYHPLNTVKGQCANCGADFCDLCGFEIIKNNKHYYYCLDCTKSFVLNILIVSIIIAIIAFILSLIFSKNFLLSIFYAYFFYSLYFGWINPIWSSNFWQKFVNLIDRLFTNSRLLILKAIINLLVLSIKITISLFIGLFGYAIFQTIKYIKIIKYQKELSKI